MTFAFPCTWISPSLSCATPRALVWLLLLSGSSEWKKKTSVVLEGRLSHNALESLFDGTHMLSYLISSNWWHGAASIDAELDLIDRWIDTLQQICIWSQNLIIVWASAQPPDCRTTGRGHLDRETSSSSRNRWTERELATSWSENDGFRGKHLVSAAYGFILKLQLGYDASEKSMHGFQGIFQCADTLLLQGPNSLDFLSSIFPICDFPRVEINQSIRRSSGIPFKLIMLLQVSGPWKIAAKKSLLTAAHFHHESGH